MLGKLLKYEMRATGRILLPIYSAVMLMGLISSIFLRIKPDMNWDNKFLMVAAVISMVLFFCFIAVSVGLSFVISIFRFKKNILGDEGYLMNTLPVTVNQNITAKVLVAVIFQILGIVVAIVAGGLFVFLGSRIPIDEVRRGIVLFMQELANLNIDYIWLYIVEGCILTLISLFTGNMIIYASMSVGHSIAAHKIISSIAVFIGFYIINQFINTFFMIIGANIFEKTGILTQMEASVYAPHYVLIGVIAMEAVYMVAYTLITNYFLKHRLNLQ